MFLQAPTHPRAFYVLALVLLAGNAGCVDRARWFSSLRTVLKNCPQESWNSSGQEEFLEKFRRCVQERALASLDALLGDDVIPVFAGLDLVRFQEDGVNSTYNDTDR